MDKKLILGVISSNGLTILSEANATVFSVSKDRLLKSIEADVQEVTDFDSELASAFINYFNIDDTIVFTVELDAEQLITINTNGSFEKAIDVFDSYKENKLKILVTPSNKKVLYDKIFSVSNKDLFKSNIFAIRRGKDLGIL
jgi:hypothetical protein